MQGREWGRLESYAGWVRRLLTWNRIVSENEDIKPI